jgi:acyl carrier protein
MTRAPITQAAIAERLTHTLAEALKLSPSTIDRHVELFSYGLDSLMALTLLGDLEEWLGQDLDPSLVWDFPTIDSLSTHVAGLIGERGGGR